MADWELAQLNIAHLLAPIDSPTLADFVSELDRINALADAAPGFVWRLQDDVQEEDPADNPFGEEFIVNISVWDSVASLFDYVYRTAHTDVMKQRKKWFHSAKSQNSVLWWVPTGHQPTAVEAKDRLDMLQANGPTANAFTFKQAFDKPA